LRLPLFVRSLPGFIIGHNEIDVAYPERAGEFK
jgi:hypothetical protein